MAQFLTRKIRRLKREKLLLLFIRGHAFFFFFLPAYIKWTFIMTKTSFTLCGVFLILTLLFSCRKEIIEIVEQEKRDGQIEYRSSNYSNFYSNINARRTTRGYLSFPCGDDFQKAFNAIVKLDDQLALDTTVSDVEAFIAFEQYFDLSSYRELIENQQINWELTNDFNLYNGSPEESRLIFCDFMSTILDENRMVKIGSSLFKFLSDDYVIEIINPTNQQSTALVNSNTPHEGLGLGKNVLSYKPQNRFNNEVLIRELNSNEFLLIPPSRIGCNYSWSINGQIFNDPVVLYELPPGQSITGEVVYDLDSSIYSFDINFRNPGQLECPVDSFLFESSLLACVGAEFNWELPVTGDGYFLYGAQLDFGDGNHEYIDIQEISEFNGKFEDYYYDQGSPSEAPTLTFVYTINEVTGTVDIGQFSSILTLLQTTTSSEFCKISASIPVDSLQLNYWSNCCTDGDANNRGSGKINYVQSSTKEGGYILTSGKMYPTLFNNTRMGLKVEYFSSNNIRRRRHLRGFVLGNLYIADPSVGTMGCAVPSLLREPIGGKKNKKRARYSEAFSSIGLLKTASKMKMKAVMESVHFIGVNFGSKNPNNDELTLDLTNPTNFNNSEVVHSSTSLHPHF